MGQLTDKFRNAMSLCYINATSRGSRAPRHEALRTALRRSLAARLRTRLSTHFQGSVFVLDSFSTTQLLVNANNGETEAGALDSRSHPTPMRL